MKNVNPVCWFDIYVSDLDRAKKFYEAVFDVKLFDLPENWGRQSTFPFQNEGENATGALVEKKDRVMGNNTIVYFSSEDCTTEETRVIEAGGNIITPKTSIGEFGYISLFQDTEGNTIGLYSKK